MRHPVLDSMEKCMKSEPVAFAPEDGQILASVSGGADSVCLLLALKELGYDTYIYEINGISHKSQSYLTAIEKAAEKKAAEQAEKTKEEAEQLPDKSNL